MRRNIMNENSRRHEIRQFVVSTKIIIENSFQYNVDLPLTTNNNQTPLKDSSQYIKTKISIANIKLSVRNDVLYSYYIRSRFFNIDLRRKMTASERLKTH